MLGPIGGPLRSLTRDLLWIEAQTNPNKPKPSKGTYTIPQQYFGAFGTSLNSLAP